MVRTTDHFSHFSGWARQPRIPIFPCCWIRGGIGTSRWGIFSFLTDTCALGSCSGLCVLCHLLVSTARSLVRMEV